MHTSSNVLSSQHFRPPPPPPRSFKIHSQNIQMHCWTWHMHLLRYCLARKYLFARTSAKRIPHCNNYIILTHMYVEWHTFSYHFSTSILIHHLIPVSITSTSILIDHLFPHPPIGNFNFHTRTPVGNFNFHTRRPLVSPPTRR